MYRIETGPIWAARFPQIPVMVVVHPGGGLSCLADIPADRVWTFDTREDAVAQARKYHTSYDLQVVALLEEAAEEEMDPGQRVPCAKHEWVYTGTAYGGDDESFHGEGRVYCTHCGADGDA